MYVLGIDTSTQVCSVGIARQARVLANHSLDEGVQHAERLVPMIQQVLADANLKLNALAGVAVASGPGSFTGLRIGMATAKGICLASGIPLVTVSTLAALAFGRLDLDLPVCAMLDARRDQIYAGVYRKDADKTNCLVEDMAIRIDELLSMIPNQAIIVGQGAQVHHHRILEKMGEDTKFFFDPPGGGNVAALGCARVALRDFAELESVEPRYLRASQAERTRGVDAAGVTVRNG